MAFKEYKGLTIPGIYKHYKGNVYVVEDVAKHSETLEDMVFYKGLYVDPTFGICPRWVRPLSMFLGNVEVNGIKIPRFKKLEEHEWRPTLMEVVNKLELK